MTVAKKIGAKQLKKMAPYKNDCGEKNWANLRINKHTL